MSMPRAVANRYLHKTYAAGTIGMYQFMRRNPKAGKRLIKRWAKPHLPADFAYDAHFVPPYNPWEQRLCVVPSADLFRAMHSHKVDMVTDHIETFTEKAIRLKSGRESESDIVITATGLKVVIIGKAEVEVDGKVVNPGDVF